MEVAVSVGPLPLPSPSSDRMTEKIKRRLLKKGVCPTPKIIRTLRKKEHLKSLRKAKRQALARTSPPLSKSQKQALAEDAHFLAVKREFRAFNREIMKAKAQNAIVALPDENPWERKERIGPREIASLNDGYIGKNLKQEHLKELGEIFEERCRGDLGWVLDDDIEVKDEWLDRGRHYSKQPRQRREEKDSIWLLVEKLSSKNLNVKDWKFGRMMKQSGLQFTEAHLLRIVEGLDRKGCWRQAMSAVDWVYSDKQCRRLKSRFVYTKLLAVLGNARRHAEALTTFNLMRGDCWTYPDMAAYHSIAVTLGQAGLLKELVGIIEDMRAEPPKRIKVKRENWDPRLEPDLIVYNAVLNACIPTRQWKGVSWVFRQLRKSGLKPNAPSYGLAMEVMVHSEKYEHVYRLFQRMQRSGEVPNALTYKVLVRALWKENKVDEAIEAVRDMEQRGVVGTASVYYELACCLSNKGRWHDAMTEVDKLKRLRRTRSLEVTFTGIISSCMDGGYVNNCISIFERMRNYCSPNIGTVNTMLKIYGQNDMFSRAKELFEKTRGISSSSETRGGGTSLERDAYTYTSMLEACARAQQWEYFEHVYKDMALSGCQLDGCKYALLLVEASKAGKRHLLEHTFDSILEAGDIPHPSIFTELICQAAAEHDYKKAITLVNSLAYAPFQVSEKDWLDLFNKNRDRLSADCLAQLSNALTNSDPANEASVLNLSRTLQVLGSSSPPIRLSVLSPPGSEPTNTSTMENCPADLVGAGEEPPPGESEGFLSDCRNGRIFFDGTDGEDGDEMSFNSQIGEEDESWQSNLPSAHEILETWKKKQKK